MPYKQTKTKHGYTNSSPNGVKGRNMTKENADAQLRLLRAIEHNPEFAKHIKSRKGKSGSRLAKPTDDY